MDFRLLGPIEVSAGDRPLHLGGTKQRAVLAMLTLAVDRVVALDHLVDGLWGPSAPLCAVNAVQVYVSRLRKVLRAGDEDGKAPIGVRRHRPGYVLETAAEQVDLHRFERLVEAGARDLRPAPARASATLRQALDLWRGPPLAEFDEQPFAETAVVRLHEQRLAALELRIEADLALGRHAALVAELEELALQHPHRERLQQQLLLSLYRSGRQADALQAYRRIQRELAEELGISPGRTLQRLETAMLAQEPHLDWTPPPSGGVSPAFAARPPSPAAGPAATALVAAAPLPAVWRVPARNPHFTGRDPLLSELHDRLTSTTGTAVQALYGLGGVGKTQLATEYAHRFAVDYEVVWWVDARQPALLADQLSGLAGALGLPTGRTAADTVDVVLRELRSRTAWLLVFDNAERPRDLVGYRPDGAGHVLITSRHPAWGALGGRLEVDVLTRAETIAMLRRRIPELGDPLADHLAQDLGDLPLAAAQAASYLEQTGLSPETYLRRFRSRRAGLLERGEVFGYEGRVSTTWALSLERLRDHDPAAVHLVELASFLAPDPIPLQVFTDSPELLEEPLRRAASDPDAMNDVVGSLVALSLARRQGDDLQLHRLVQAVVRHQLPEDRQRSSRQRVITALAAAAHGAPENPASWTRYARLAPHVLTCGSLADGNADGRQLVLRMIVYLGVRGDGRSRRVVAEEVHDRWRRALGPDHPDSLSVATTLISTLTDLADYAAARVLGQDTVGRCERAFGPEHPTTLRAAVELAMALTGAGEPDRAAVLARRTLRRCRLALGRGHPTTLRSAAVLAQALAWDSTVTSAGQVTTLGRVTLETSRQQFGPDHPTTLSLASDLTSAFAWSGEFEAARTLGSDTLGRCCRSLGADHPATLHASAALSSVLSRLGDANVVDHLGRDTLQRCERALGADHPVTLRVAAALATAQFRLGNEDRAKALGRDVRERSRHRFGPEHPITLRLDRVLDMMSRLPMSASCDPVPSG
jgi:DNA-binding SARP family transcriptional activator